MSYKPATIFISYLNDISNFADIDVFQDLHCMYLYIDDMSWTPCSDIT